MHKSAKGYKCIVPHAKLPEQAPHAIIPPVLMARHNSIRFAAFVLLVTLVLLQTKSISAEQPPRVFAFYYAWFDEQTWVPSHVADMPVEQYVSRDGNAIARHIDQANGAGIDSFVVSWLGPGNPTDERFKMMLDLAGGKNFSATIDFEANQYGSRDALINALMYVRDRLMPHGAFARVNGKPVLFFWRQQVRSVDEWAEIRNIVDPERDQVWIAEGVNIAYQRVFDGHHLYSIAWSPDVNYTLNDWAKRVRRAGAEKLWVATVMPGYDDTRTTRAGKFARNRQDGNFYRNAWNAALSTQPDLLIINSWNEWVEGSMIEPSVTYGELYLEITREFVARFKAQPPPSWEEKIARAATATPRPTRTATVIPTRRATNAPTATRGPSPTPTATPIELAAYRTTEILRVRAGPGTNFEMLGKLPREFVLDVLARSEDSKWLAIAYPDFGSLGWISAEFVTPQNGLEQFPIEPSLLLQNGATENSAAPAPLPFDDPLPVWY